jgi:hypothetical protein
MHRDMWSVQIVELAYIVAQLGFQILKSNIKALRFALNLQQNEKMKKNRSILSFFNQPKPAIVLSTIPDVQPVQSLALPWEKVPDTNLMAAAQEDESITMITPHGVSQFIKKLTKLMKNLPNTIPEASDNDKLAGLGQDPSSYDDKMFNKDDLWEEEINTHLKRILGWGTEENIKDLI